MTAHRLTRLAALALGLSAFLGLPSPTLCGQEAADGTPTEAAPKSREERLAWFREARFGMFVHWGPVSLKGTEIGWSRGAQVPEAEYDQLYKKFDPVRFSAEEWVATARAARMRYLVITSKHHDGFSLWDSAASEYDMAATPSKRDILRELSGACKEKDLRFCTYYSVCDWWHPDYPLGSPGGRKAKPTSNMPRYLTYMLNQLDEILDGYGPIGILWFDGEWEKPWKREYGQAIYDHLLRRQPDIIVNNRVGKGREGMAGTTRQSTENPGDYDTPEQRVGTFNRDRPWESCITICRQWAWKPNDRLKSLDECIRILLQTVGGDGNLLLNVGPMPDGRIEPRQVERLKEMGRWICPRSRGIFGTRGGPFLPGRWGAATCKDRSIFLFVLEWPESGVLELPPIPRRVVRTREIGADRPEFTQTDEKLTVTVPEDRRDPIATLVELVLDGPAFEIPPVRVPDPPSGSVTHARPVRASNTFLRKKEFGPELAVDDDPKTRWATDTGTSEAWLEVDLGEPVSVGRVFIDEREWKRVRGFQLEYRVGEEWQTMLAGKRIGARYEKTFPPVTARHVRLHVLEATDGPTIWEFRLFPPAE